MSNFKLKMKLILWKNFKIRHSRILSTVFEVLIPVTFILIFVVVNSMTSFSQSVYINETEHFPIQTETNKLKAVFYAPNNTQTNKIMDNVKQSIVSPNGEFRGFQTESSLMTYVLNLLQKSIDESDDVQQAVGIIFNNVPEDKLPTSLDYKIRGPSPLFDINKLYSISGLLEASDFFYYFTSNFISVQQAVDSAFIKLHKSINFSITCQKMPSPPHRQNTDVKNEQEGHTLSVIIIYAFILSLLSIVRRVLDEKESGMTELMKMMGLRPWMIWLGWYIHSMITIFPAVIIMTILFKVEITVTEKSASMFPNSDIFILILFLFMYCTSMICYAFFMSTLFNKPMLGVVTAIVVWILTLTPINIIMEKPDPNSLSSLRNFLLIFPNTCLFSGLHTILEFENKGSGITWSNLYRVPNDFGNLRSMGALLFILLVESLFLLLLTWYISQVKPGQYGVRKPWNFCWLRKEQPAPDIPEDNSNSRDAVEAVGLDLQPGIQIRHLHKKFNNTTAVNDLSFDIYTNQITVLLGHNGAGKTTTMNIISGMLEPTSGVVLVDGHDIKTHMDTVRESLGLCPQHNVYFSDLTVLEHLIFFAMLKGMQEKEARIESLEYLSRLGISQKANEKPDSLSGGMKRRLSLGLALVGPTKVLMLDEPTSGMDPEARREIWDLLLSMRGSRTILITTHYMEEADVLGDRIAIMYSGQLMCYGTSLFLKKHYGAGYTLSVLVGHKYDLNQITNVIKQFIPNANVKSVTVGSIKLELPTNDTAALTQLFLELENAKSILGINNFGVSLTTMDDVFLNVGKIADETDKSKNKSSTVNSQTFLLSDNFTKDPERKYNTGSTLLKQQFWALLVKRMQYHKHKWLLFLIAFFLPILLQIFIGTLQILLAPGADINKILNLDLYPSAISYYSNDKDTETLASYYEKAVKQQERYPIHTEEVSKQIVNTGVESLDTYKHKLVSAAEIKSSGGHLFLNAMYGAYAVHSPAISVNLITNALLKLALSDEKASITIGNNPLQPPLQGVSEGLSIMLSIIIPLGITLLVSFLLMFHVDERVSGVKHLQIMYGVPRYFYWVTNYIFDMFVYLCVTFFLVTIIVAFRDNLSYSAPLGAFILLMILFGLAVFPFAYFFHFCSNHGRALFGLLMFYIVFCIVMPICFMLLELFGDEKLKLKLLEVLQFIFMVSPHYAFCSGIIILVAMSTNINNWETSNQVSMCQQLPPPPCCVPDSKECRDFYNMFTEDKLMYCLIYLSAAAVVYFLIFLFIDYGFVTTIVHKIRDKKETENEKLDTDVVEEQKRVTTQMNESTKTASISNNSDVLLVSNLRKSFSKFPAVKGLHFGVNESKCFGLLGINGAGKTTTFKMLVGEMLPTTGTANILGYSLRKNRKIYLNQIGYCPQFDALNFQLTTRELLTFFSHLRGIPANKTRNHVNMWLQKFDLMKYHDVQAEKLSGGNKRKLSTTIALIGDPPIVMLDEPTSGVDPVARRNLWGILALCRKAGQAIVLTSHSMDECEALCDRLAIMVDGQMKCIGSIQHLKSKFGQGFTVMIKLKYVTFNTNESGDAESSFKTHVDDLKAAIEKKYECILKDEHKGMVMYHITDKNGTLGTIFWFMENLKQTREIVEDFTVSDTSLEQVFISFARERVANKINKKQGGGNIV